MSQFIQNYLAAYGATASLFGIIWYILVAIGLWKVFTKANESGWKALIPIYNQYILYKISWKGSMFWINILFNLVGLGLLVFTNNVIFATLGMALNLVGSIMTAVMFYNLSISYGHGFPFFLGLFFLQPIFIMILGFGRSRYLGNRYR